MKRKRNKHSSIIRIFIPLIVLVLILVVGHILLCRMAINSYVPDWFNTKTLKVGEIDKPQAAIWCNIPIFSGTYSSDPHIATVSWQGVVTAKNPGTVYIVIRGLMLTECYQYTVEGMVGDDVPGNTNEQDTSQTSETNVKDEDLTEQTELLAEWETENNTNHSLGYLEPEKTGNLYLDNGIMLSDQESYSMELLRISDRGADGYQWYLGIYNKEIDPIRLEFDNVKINGIKNGTKWNQDFDATKDSQMVVVNWEFLNIAPEEITSIYFEVTAKRVLSDAEDKISQKGFIVQMNSPVS